MPISDRTIGNLLHLGTSAFLGYYLVWVLGMPFVDDDHPFQNFFPPKEYGVAFPAVVLGFVFTTLTTIAFWCMYGVEPPALDMKLYEKYSKPQQQQTKEDKSSSSASSTRHSRKSSSNNNNNTSQHRKKSSQNIVG